jgi:membrane-bound serine protease (ClpP class)
MLPLAALVAAAQGGVASEAGAVPTGRVVLVSVDGEIDLGLAPYVQRSIAQATERDLLILRINTFGGRIDAAVQIRDALLSTKAKTVAFIDRRAISAGALISLATDVIAMTPGATIGAATPVQLETGTEMKPVEAKVVSYMRKEMRSTAEAKGRRGDVAEAMVDASVEIPGLDSKEQTLTLTTAEALKWKVAAFEVPDLATLLIRLERPRAQLSRYEINWAERLARFFTRPVVTGLLMSLGMLGILIELYHPTHFAAAGGGLLCLGLFFFGQSLAHLAGWQEVLLFTLGLLLLLVEAFVIPGFGIAGIAAIVLMVASLVFALVDLRHMPLEVGWAIGWLPRALTTVLAAFLLTFLLLVLSAYLLPRTRVGRGFMLDAKLPRRTRGAPGGERRPQVGQRGVVVAACRPAGKALLDGQRFDVVAEGELIEVDEPVEVIHVEGIRVVVKGSQRT